MGGNTVTVFLIITFIIILLWFATTLESMFEITKPNIYQFLSWLIYVCVLLTILFFIGKKLWERIV